MSEHQTGTTPTASSPATPKTSDADWVVDRIAQQRAVRAQAEEFHNRPLDNQAGIAELLAAITAAPLPQFEEAVYELASELAATLISKQQDYGPRAISAAPGGPTLGVLVRAHDKLERLVHLTGRDGIANNESIRDSWLDLAGYAFIGLLLADGVWPQ